MRGSILVLWAIVLAVPARAEDAAADRSVIAAYLSNKPEAAQRRTCIGRVATPCQDLPDGASTPGIVACFEREHAVWDGLLNRSYREAMAVFDEDGKASLKGAQQTWLKFRAQACEWPSKLSILVFASAFSEGRQPPFGPMLYPDGSIRGPLAAACRLDQTALRAIDLMEIASPP